MIKVDYEGAWKELKREYNNISSCRLEDKDAMVKFLTAERMDELEKKHTHNYIDIRKRSDKELADYCLKKHAEVYLELVELKGKLKKLTKRGENDFKGGDAYE